MQALELLVETLTLKVGFVAALGSMTAAVAAIFAVLVARRNLKSLGDQLHAQLYAEYTRRYQNIILEFPENINEPTFDLAKLKDEEREKYDKTMRRMRAYFDLCYEEWLLARPARGFIDKDTWDDWREGMKAATGKPAFQQAWERISKDQQYGEKFEEFLHKLMTGEPATV